MAISPQQSATLPSLFSSWLFFIIIFCHFRRKKPFSETCLISAGVLSRVLLLATPWTVAHQAPRFMGFESGKDTGLQCLPPGDPPNPETERTPFMSPSLAPAPTSLPLGPPGKPRVD